jgi:DNA-binding response OmpR family regulator
MIVDDNTDLVEMLKISLGNDFEVTTASNGMEGVERVILYQPDLIVLDALLPKMSGYQLCTSIRRNRNFRRTPIVFISAKASEKDQEYCRRLGANDFLPKPFDPQLLKQRLMYQMRADEFVVRRKKLTLEDIRQREKTEVEWEEQRQDRAESRRGAVEIKRLIDDEMRP